VHARTGEGGSGKQPDSIAWAWRRWVVVGRCMRGGGEGGLACAPGHSEERDRGESWDQATRGASGSGR
jgi:hypothetical protein